MWTEYRESWVNYLPVWDILQWLRELATSWLIMARERVNTLLWAWELNRKKQPNVDDELRTLAVNNGAIQFSHQYLNTQSLDVSRVQLIEQLAHGLDSCEDIQYIQRWIRYICLFSTVINRHIWFYKLLQELSRKVTNPSAIVAISLLAEHLEITHKISPRERGVILLNHPAFTEVFLSPVGDRTNVTEMFPWLDPRVYAAYYADWRWIHNLQASRAA